MEGVRTATELWVFGYGSLIWRPGDLVHTHQLAPVCIKGYRRVFHQGSTDRRGVPGAPCRVVTLLPDAQAVTWGTALRVPPPGAGLLRGACEAVRRVLEGRFFTSIDGSAEPVVAQALVFVASVLPLVLARAAVCVPTKPANHNKPTPTCFCRVFEHLRLFETEKALVRELRCHTRSPRLQQ
jgi:hypothetical protein